MNRFSLVIRNIVYHARANLAVLLGSAVGAAVLTGALLVGDSLRGSLREHASRRLVGVEAVLVGSRFVRQELADQLPGKVMPAILMQASVRGGKGESERRIGKVTVLGIDGRFGVEIPPNPSTDPKFNEAIPTVLSQSVAQQLQVEVGEPLTLCLEKAGGAPKASFLGERGTEKATRSPTLIVSAILPSSHPANDFSLTPGATVPLNVFIPVDRLQAVIEQTGRVNALLGIGESAQSLQSVLSRHLDLSDWDLNVRIPPQRRAYLSVESKRMFLEPSVITAVEATAQEMGLRSTRTLVYLANSITVGTKSIPYSVIAAVDVEQSDPLGPFLPPGVTELKPGEIILVDWKDSPLKLEPNAPVKVSYYKTEIEDRIGEDDAIEELHADLIWKGPLLPFEGAALDRHITPEFPGITDQKAIRNWKSPFTIPEGRIQPRDERYWEKFGTTPKAYIRYEDGVRLWQNRFGTVTSIRIAPPKDGDIDATLAEFRKRLRDKLDPKDGGLVFEPIRERLMEAGKGSTDFGMLFLAFSFFLIVAALMLVALLFRLNLERRAKEIGLLRATGFPQSDVRRMMLFEGLLLAVVGSLIGLVGAMFYAGGLLKLLAWLWPTSGIGSFLQLHITPMSLMIGFFASVLMSGLAILWALRLLSKASPTGLLKGDAGQGPTKTAEGTSRRSLWVAGVSVVGAIVLVVIAPSMPPGEPQAGTFFGAGFLLLTAGLAFSWWALKRPSTTLLTGYGAAAMNRLGMRNAARNPTRSLLTIGLLASAVFLIVAVESFRREPDKDFLERTGGSGGFPLVAETATPILFDLNDDGGRGRVEESLRKWVQDNVAAEKRAERLGQALGSLKHVKLQRFRLHGGDDASCLNLFQATRPRLLGVPNEVIERGGFRFSGTVKKTDTPWRLLQEPSGDGTIPVMVEENTATWMLKKGIGDTFEVPDQDNKPMKLRIVATLKDSVFQSEVLMPDEAFRKHFSRSEGFSYFLVETSGDADAAAYWLAVALRTYGFEATRSRDRLASYLAVQNTYLTTFQLLGGFGLMLGVLGLAVVLLRNVWERQGELALLRAMGYRHRSISQVIFSESVRLSIQGLLIGVIAAILSVLPHLEMPSRFPWLRLGGLVLGGVALGLVIAYIAVARLLRAELIASLRKD